jgi:hypothetical protein
MPASRPSPAALGLNCPVCLTLFDEPVTLQCGHSLCAACKNGLVVPKTRELAPAVHEWRADPLFPVGSFRYEKYRTSVQTAPAKTEAYSAVSCPSCRKESRCDALCTSVQLRASIGALFPELVQARTTVKRLETALQAARVGEFLSRMAHTPMLAEKAAAIAAANAAEQRRVKAIAMEANEAERLARAAAKVAETKAELGAAQRALEKAQDGGAIAGQKRKR